MNKESTKATTISVVIVPRRLNPHIQSKTSLIPIKFPTFLPNHEFLVPSDRLRPLVHFRRPHDLPAWLLYVCFEGSLTERMYEKRELPFGTIEKFIKCGLQTLVEIDEKHCLNTTPLAPLCMALWLARGYKLTKKIHVLKKQIEKLRIQGGENECICELFMDTNYEAKLESLKSVEELVPMGSIHRGLMNWCRVELKMFEKNIIERRISIRVLSESEDEDDETKEKKRDKKMSSCSVS